MSTPSHETAPTPQDLPRVHTPIAQTGTSQPVALTARGTVAVRSALNPEDRPIWPGTDGPSQGTPPRAPRSIRRTTTLDITFPSLGVLVLHGVGRDLLTNLTGYSDSSDSSIEAIVLDQTEATIEVDHYARLVSAIEIPGADEGQHEAAQQLIGVPATGKLRKMLGVYLPEEVSSGSLLVQILDDVPAATLIAGSALFRQGLIEPSPSSEKRRPQVDVCTGWKSGGVMAQAIIEDDVPYMGEGPLAPTLLSDTDPLAWHEFPPLSLGAMRRHRRLDITKLDAGSDSTDGYALDIFFRDSFVEPDGRQSVVHEYGITGTLDSQGTITAMIATPHVIPGPECPGAAASAQRVIGLPLSEVRAHVTAEFSGISTCTHLNDMLRSLGTMSTLFTQLQ
jgi:Protein of unknown function (DUF2889)